MGECMVYSSLELHLWVGAYAATKRRAIGLIHSTNDPTSGADSIGRVGHVPLTFTNVLAQGGTVSRRTDNNKLTKL